MLAGHTGSPKFPTAALFAVLHGGDYALDCAMRDSSDPSAAGPSADTPAFTAVAVRERQTGWTPARQIAFVQALADTACVTEAAARVGMSPSSAYQLRRRPDAGSFRAAWEAALDHAVGRLADAALGRALNGVATPVFFQGEQIGERRRFDERLTMFLLRYRRPESYGAWLDHMSARERHPDGPAIRLAEALRRVAEDGAADRAGRPRPAHRPLRATLLTDEPAEAEAAEAAAAAQDEAAREAEWERWLATLGAEADGARAPAPTRSGRDVA